MTDPWGRGTEWRQFLILSRDSVRRLLNGAVHSRDTDPMQFALWVAALAATLPTLFAIRMIFMWSSARYALSLEAIESLAIANRLFFIFYGMIASALLAALLWETLLPDRSDQEIVGVLPVRARTVAAARVAAATAIAVAFSIAINGVSGLLFAVATSAAFGLAALPMLFVGHIVSTTFACLLVFFTLLTIRGTVAAIAGPSAGSWVATVLQLVTIVTLIEVFLYLPSLLPPVVEHVLRGDRMAARFPPAWFAGLYSWMAGSDRTVLAEGARLAIVATFAAALSVVGTYLLPAAYLSRRTLEVRSRERARLMTTLTRAVASLIPSPPVRGMFVFSIASFIRSRRHLFILASYLGVGVGCALVGIIAAEARNTLSIAHPRAYLLALPMVMTFCAVLGLRAAFAVPTDLDANWPFRLREPTPATATNAASATILAMGVVPIAALAFVASMMAGWAVATAATIALFNLVSGAFLVEAALFRWRKVPFACAHVPAQDTVKGRWAFFIVFLNWYAFQLANVQEWALASFARAMQYAGIFALLILVVRMARIRTTRGGVDFDGAPQDTLQTLGLSEAVH
jgi:hypothetical protein